MQSCRHTAHLLWRAQRRSTTCQGDGGGTVEMQRRRIAKAGFNELAIHAQKAHVQLVEDLKTNTKPIGSRSKNEATGLDKPQSRRPQTEEAQGPDIIGRRRTNGQKTKEEYESAEMVCQERQSTSHGARGSDRITCDGPTT